MPTATARIAALGVAIAASVLVLSACAGTASTTQSAQSSESQAGADARSASPGSATGEAYGCTEAILDFLPANGFPDAVPQDPSTFILPGGVTAAVVPECLVRDEYGGAPRYAAFFPASAGATAAVGSALTAAGYDTFAPGVWIIGGDDPTTAEHAVGGGDTTIDGVGYSWFAY